MPCRSRPAQGGGGAGCRADGTLGAIGGLAGGWHAVGRGDRAFTRCGARAGPSALGMRQARRGSRCRAAVTRGGGRSTGRARGVACAHSRTNALQACTIKDPGAAGGLRWPEWRGGVRSPAIPSCPAAGCATPLPPVPRPYAVRRPVRTKQAHLSRCVSRKWAPAPGLGAERASARAVTKGFAWVSGRTVQGGFTLRLRARGGILEVREPVGRLGEAGWGAVARHARPA
jgi:hypothetical protein